MYARVLYFAEANHYQHGPQYRNLAQEIGNAHRHQGDGRR